MELLNGGGSWLHAIVEGYVVQDVQCVATDRDNVLLGRDVLNDFVITLDGENLTFSLTH